MSCCFFGVRRSSKKKKDMSRKLGVCVRVRVRVFFCDWEPRSICAPNMSSRLCDGVSVAPNLQGRENPSPLLSSVPAAFFSLRDARGRTARRKAGFKPGYSPEARDTSSPLHSSLNSWLRTDCTARCRAGWVAGCAPRAGAMTANRSLTIARPKVARWPTSGCHNGRQNSCQTHCETVASYHRDAPLLKTHISASRALASQDCSRSRK